MRLKDDAVKLSGIKPELVFAAFVADEVCKKYGQEAVITSAVDGKHSLTSLHYPGYAIDIRTYFFTTDIQFKVRSEIKERLGIDYDVVLEKDHIHIEFQPRYR